MNDKTTALYPNLLKHAERFAAISDTGRSLTYKELFDFTEKIRAVVEPRTIVFVLCENTLGNFAGCVAFLNSAVVPVLLSASIDRQLLKSLLETYQPEYIYAPKRLLTEFPHLKPFHFQHECVLLRSQYERRSDLNQDLALLLPTSGSTGSPKLVRHSYDNLRSNGHSIIEYLGISSEERAISSLPMQYSFGFSVINSHLLAGATICLTTRTIVEREFWAFLKDRAVTSFAGVPYTFEILERLRFFRMDVPTIKTIVQAGGKLPLERVQKYADFAERKGIKLFIMYGQTEASPRMSYLSPENTKSKPDSIGKAIPGGEFFLIDGQGTRVAEPHKEGELVYQGANVTLGYAFTRNDLSKGDEFIGVLNTGDIAYRDENDFYYITGRKSRFIKLFGNRVNLDEAEQIVRGITADCACSGVDDKMDIYVTQAGVQDEVRKLVSSKTGIHPTAFRVTLVSEIPKTEAGKTLYAELAGGQ